MLLGPGACSTGLTAIDPNPASAATCHMHFGKSLPASGSVTSSINGSVRWDQSGQRWPKSGLFVSDPRSENGLNIFKWLEKEEDTACGNYVKFTFQCP